MKRTLVRRKWQGQAIGRAIMRRRPRSGKPLRMRSTADLINAVIRDKVAAD